MANLVVNSNHWSLSNNDTQPLMKTESRRFYGFRSDYSILEPYGKITNGDDKKTHTKITQTYTSFMWKLTGDFEIFVWLFCIDHPVVVLLALTGHIVDASLAYALSAIVLIELTPSFSVRYLLFTSKLMLNSPHIWNEPKNKFTE